MNSRSNIAAVLAACFFILILALTGCGKSQPTAAPAQQQNPPAQAEPAATNPPAEPSPVPPSPTPEIQRGPGSFDLTDPGRIDGEAAGYQAVLRLVFDGMRDGQPYHEEKTYDVLHNRGDDAHLLTETSVRADGTSAQSFSGVVMGIGYRKPAPDQPCQAGRLPPQPAPFSPSGQLPSLLGAEPAGQETLGDIATDVYIFDQRALGAGDKATASGKVWVSQQLGHVVKYELVMQSDTVFGPGITGEQRWEYALVELVRPFAEVLPVDCPLPLTSAPVMDSAADLVYLPGEIRYQTTAAADVIAAFYAEQFKAQGYLPQGEAVETSGGTRWVFGKQADGQAVVMLLTVKPGENGAGVRVTRIVTDAPPAQ